jgi:H+/Cl- antiporter ClcA
LLGSYLYLGYPNVKGLHFSIYFGVAGSAAIAGIFGSLMCKAILKLSDWKRSFTGIQNIFFVLAAGLLIAGIAFYINPIVIGSGHDIMNEVLFSKEKAVNWQTVVLRIVGPIIAFLTGSAAGIFAPSLAAGATLGAFIATVFNVSGADANILILGAMVGFLTGVTRTPFTSAILVLEMTDRHSVIFHLMIAAMVSHLASLLIDKHSFYEHLKKRFVEDAVNDKGTIAAT